MSLPALLRAQGFSIDLVQPRFMPYSMRGTRLPITKLARRAVSAIAVQADGRSDADRARTRGLTMYGSKTVSVVLPAYNEEQYIRAAVEDFF